MGQGCSGNSIWGIVKILIPVIIGFILAFSSTLWRDRLKNRKHLKNIRKVLFLELKHDYRLIITHMPQEEDISKANVMPLLVGVVSELPSSVYEAYLDRLAELPKEEMDKIYIAYTHIKECRDRARLIAQIIRSGKATVQTTRSVLPACEAALESISIVLLRDSAEKESLDSLQKERGRNIPE